METEEQRKAILGKMMLPGKVRKLRNGLPSGRRKPRSSKRAEDEGDSEASGSGND